jgi:hypothetical protein
MLSGFQRSFAATLMIALLYYLHKGRFCASAIVIITSALIYPPVFLLAAGTWAVLILLQTDNRGKAYFAGISRRAAPLVIAVAVSVLILFPAIRTTLRSAPIPERSETVSSNPQPAYDRLWQDPKYGKEGRRTLFTLFPILGRGGIFNKPLDMIYALVLGLLGGGFYMSTKGERTLRLPFELVSVLPASLLLFFLAWLAVVATDSFLLYLPSRYTRVGLSLFTSLFVFLNLERGLQATADLLHQNTDKLAWATVAIEVLALGLVFSLPNERTQIAGVNMKGPLIAGGVLLALLTALSIRNSNRRTASEPSTPPAHRRFIKIAIILCLVTLWGMYGRWVHAMSTLNPSNDERALLEYLQTLSKDTLIAGTPCALDNVPLFAKRQVLFSCEQPSGDSDLVMEALGAYYAQDEDTVLTFCETHGIDYLVVDDQAYREESLDWIFFEPYNEAMLSIIGDQCAFALGERQENAELFRAGRFRVLACDDRLISE